MNERWIGILGGGQLGRMLALAGYPLGLRFRIYDPDPHAPAGMLAEHIAAAYDDVDALHRFVQGLEVVTYEFENVPVQTAQQLQQQCPVYPPPVALEKAQDRLVEKQFFQQVGIPTPLFAAVASLDELEAAIGQVGGLPAVLKTRRWGYDGKGQVVLQTQQQVASAWEHLGGVACILEQRIVFTRELSILAVRGRDGTIACYPLVENIHQQGILHRSLAPAANVSAALQQQAEEYARRLVQDLDYVGVVALELFETANNGLLANEMAPRVHNSGHWTIEGAQTSQFANHLRAILGLPLGATAATGQCEMTNMLGTLPESSSVLAQPNTYLHLYGKAPRPGRKLGHITTVVRPLTGGQ
jgi:5-(carboxyamino)imidazole ribonucleotide synthase